MYIMKNLNVDLKIIGRNKILSYIFHELLKYYYVKLSFPI